MTTPCDRFRGERAPPHGSAPFLHRSTRPTWRYFALRDGRVVRHSTTSLAEAVLGSFRAGLDTALTAIALRIDESTAANILARSRDAGRGTQVPPVRSAGHGARDCLGPSSLDFGRPGSSEPAPAVLSGAA